MHSNQLIKNQLQGNTKAEFSTVWKVLYYIAFYDFQLSFEHAATIK